uniref:Uncharacterized protein n=1 Tax=Clastoptera arizonana TaxID=38151 RepID=A0A1B6D9F8_9HEMI
MELLQGFRITRPIWIALVDFVLYIHFFAKTTHASISIERSADYGVFYSFDGVMEVFNDPKYFNTTAVQHLMKTYQETYPYDPRRRYGRRKPFIVVESTRRDSRRSVGWMLARSTGSRYMSNPPRSLVPLRELFDEYGGLLRRAFFSISMYAAAHDVLEVMYRYPVVMSGYWHDQAAFAIAKEYPDIEDLPPPGDPIYRWPADLLKPDLVFFINAPDRGQEGWKATPRPNYFKPKLVEVMRRMHGMPILEINDTYLYDEMLQRVQVHLDRYLTGKLNFERVLYKDIVSNNRDRDRDREY